MNDMRRYLLLVCIYMMPMAMYAQDDKLRDNDESKSEAVAFLERDGSLIKKEFYSLGMIGRTEFEVLLLTDVLKEEKEGCLRIKTSSSLDRASDTYIGTLDRDELEACIKSMEYIKNSILTSKSEVYTECEYLTKDGVKLGAFIANNGKWTLFVKTKKYISRSMQSIPVKEIDNLISILSISKNVIDDLLAGKKIEFDDVKVKKSKFDISY